MLHHMMGLLLFLFLPCTVLGSWRTLYDGTLQSSSNVASNGLFSTKEGVLFGDGSIQQSAGSGSGPVVLMNIPVTGEPESIMKAYGIRFHDTTFSGITTDFLLCRFGNITIPGSFDKETEVFCPIPRQPWMEFPIVLPVVDGVDVSLTLDGGEEWSPLRENVKFTYSVTEPSILASEANVYFHPDPANPIPFGMKPIVHFALQSPGWLIHESVWQCTISTSERTEMVDPVIDGDRLGFECGVSAAMIQDARWNHSDIHIAAGGQVWIIVNRGDLPYDTHAAAWATFNGVGSPMVMDSYNIESITYYGTGEYTVVLSTPMMGQYAVVGACNMDPEPGQFLMENTPDSNDFRIGCRLAGSAPNQDSDRISFAVFGTPSNVSYIEARGKPRGWIQFNGDLAAFDIRGHGGIMSTCNYIGTGTYEYLFDDPFPNTNYALLGLCDGAGNGGAVFGYQGGTPTGSSILGGCFDQTPISNRDSERTFGVVFGTHPDDDFAIWGTPYVHSYVAFNGLTMDIYNKYGPINITRSTIEGEYFATMDPDWSGDRDYAVFGSCRGASYTGARFMGEFGILDRTRAQFGCRTYANANVDSIYVAIVIVAGG